MLGSTLMDIPSPLTAALDREEKLLWWDRPLEGLMLRSTDIYSIPISAMVLVFTIFWERTAIYRNGSAFFVLWGIPFTLLALYGLIGRFFYDAWCRRRTVYGLTSQRVVIITPGETKSLEIASLSEINFKETGDGTGTISFGSEPSICSRHDRGTWSGRPTVPTFERIKDARRVLAAIREAQKAARQTS